jgi:histidyl-tRNA synthetase
MFRHERPQKGRYRQFHQIGVEAFGMDGPDIDAELIILSARIWKTLGIGDLTLQINSLGTPECRVEYRKKLVEYLEKHHAVLDEDSRRRLTTNPLRVLDSKNPALQEIIAHAPSLLEHLDSESRGHFEVLKERLEVAGVAYSVNTRLVRGLDYYTRTVFEWVTGALGSQGTVCAGGRYDGLVEQLGGRPTTAAGFAMGIERLVELAAQQQVAGVDASPHVYLVLLGELAERNGIMLAEFLRDHGLRVESNCGGGSLKSQMKRADRSGAPFAMLLGEAEVLADLVSIKSLRRDEPQKQMPVAEATAYISQRLQSH